MERFPVRFYVTELQEGIKRKWEDFKDAMKMVRNIDKEHFKMASHIYTA